MILFPAIDMKDGTCVRLYQGDFSTAERVAADPLQTALSFRRAGAEWLHMVDLDGAKQGAAQNGEIFEKIAAESGLKVELGGGIRDMQTIQHYLSHGISRVILGSAALRSPDLVREAVREYGDRIAVGIDAKNEMVAADGWLHTSKVHYLDMAKAMEQLGVSYLIYTDISKDGTLTGPNFQQLQRIDQAVSCSVIASGGVSCLEDIKALKQMGLYGAICGKSIYSGALDLAAALAAGRE